MEYLFKKQYCKTWIGSVNKSKFPVQNPAPPPADLTLKHYLKAMIVCSFLSLTGCKKNTFIANNTGYKGCVTCSIRLMGPLRSQKLSWQSSSSRMSTILSNQIGPTLSSQTHFHCILPSVLKILGCCSCKIYSLSP